MARQKNRQKTTNVPHPILEPLEPRLLLNGLTVITHGWEDGDTAPAWLDAMATAVATQDGPNTAVYKLTLTNNGSIPETSFQLLRGDAPTDPANTSGDAVLEIDWAADTSIVVEGPGFGTAQLAPYIIPYITDALPQYGLSVPLGNGPIQLIGHSRGASLVSEIAKDLGISGLWVNQLTTLDPHPVSPSTDLTDLLNVTDAAVEPTTNVIFADNYYETENIYPAGETVPGAHEVGALDFGTGTEAHEDVHTFYYGTIDTSPTASEAGTPVPASWYTDNNLDRITTGFYYSTPRVLLPLDGIGTPFGGAGTRVAVTPSGTQWPNVYLDNNSISSANYTVQAGRSILVSFDYQDSQTAPTVTLALTTGLNPYIASQFVPADPANIISGETYARGQINLTTLSALSFATTSLDTTNVPVGNYYILAAITDGTNVRYAYLPNQITIAPPIATTTTLAIPTSITSGSSATLVASLAPTASTTQTPTGTITFFDGATTLGTAPLSGTTATFTAPSLAAGVHTITATYNGDANFSASYSAAQTLTVTAPVSTPAPGTLIPEYRLYLAQTAEHLYTTDLNEYTVLATRGWNQEGIAYYVYSGPATVDGVSAEPYYRLYNPSLLQHLWTTDLNEYTLLATQGWNQEGIIGYIFATQATNTIPLYRLYQSNAHVHLWTSDLNEYDTLASNDGWTQEGIIGYILAQNSG